MSDILITENNEISKVEFDFNVLTTKDVEDVLKNSRVFNTSISGFSDEIIVENRFDTEFGSSQERLDMYVYSKGCFLNIRELINLDIFKVRIEGKESGVYNMRGIIEELVSNKGITLIDLLVVRRVMSNYALDSSTSNIEGILYHICDDDIYGIIKENPGFGGLLASKMIRVDNINDCRDKLIDSYKKGTIDSYYYSKYSKILESE